MQIKINNMENKWRKCKMIMNIVDIFLKYDYITLLKIFNILILNFLAYDYKKYKGFIFNCF